MQIKNIFIFIFIVLFTNCQKKNSSDITKYDKKNSNKIIKIENIGLKTDKDNGGLFLPDGFGALVVADSVGPSRHLAVNDNGDIYVKLRVATGNNGNIALRDTNNDGVSDIDQVFAQGFNYPFGIEINSKYLFIADLDYVWKIPYKEGQLINDVDPIKLTKNNAL